MACQQSCFRNFKGRRWYKRFLLEASWLGIGVGKSSLDRVAYGLRAAPSKLSWFADRRITSLASRCSFLQSNYGQANFHSPKSSSGRSWKWWSDTQSFTCSK